MALTPRTVGAITSYSRRTLINASPGIEAIVRNDLAAVIGAAIDRAAMLGDGAGNTPTGITHQLGVAPSTLSAPPTWAEVLAFPTALAMLDADIAALGWAIAPDAVAKLRAALREGSGAAGFIMTDPNSLIGYPAATTTALSTGTGSGATSTVIFGAWSQLPRRVLVRCRPAREPIQPIAPTRAGECCCA